ncbi:hypothetical protein ACIPPS_12025 [Streptomyces sp. NPDC090127]
MTILSAPDAPGAKPGTPAPRRVPLIIVRLCTVPIVLAPTEG